MEQNVSEEWFVYALFSPEHKRIYIGMTKRPEERLKEHNSGKMRSTKRYRPWVKVFQEKANNRLEAREKEKYFKTTTGRNKIKTIISNLGFDFT